jgi:hypothetical protein
LQVGLTLLDLDTAINLWYTLGSPLSHGNPSEWAHVAGSVHRAPMVMMASEPAGK